MSYLKKLHCKAFYYSVMILRYSNLLAFVSSLFGGKSLSLPATACAATHSSGDTPQHPMQSKSAVGFSITKAGNSRRKRDFRSGLWPFSSTPPKAPHPTAPEGSRHKPREAQLLRVPRAGTASGDFISLPPDPPLPPIAALRACPPTAHNSSGSVASSDAIRILPARASSRAQPVRSNPRNPRFRAPRPVRAPIGGRQGSTPLRVRSSLTTPPPLPFHLCSSGLLRFPPCACSLPHGANFAVNLLRSKKLPFGYFPSDSDSAFSFYVDTSTLSAIL